MTSKNKTCLFIIDDEFNIIFLDENFRKKLSLDDKPKHCYEVMANSQEHCENCPLKNTHANSIVYNELLNEWVKVSHATVNWPEHGKCQMVISNGIEDEGKDLLGHYIEHSDYHELLEINYEEDTFKIIKHTKSSSPEIVVSGNISSMVKKCANRVLHPDDVNRFCDFWLLDEVGKKGIPNRLFVSRHSEFRKKKMDGSYGWIHEEFIPSRQSTKNTIYLLHYFSSIDTFYSNANPNTEFSDEALSDRPAFLDKATNCLKNANDELSWCMIALDIKNFKLFNEWYGENAGNELLADISSYLRNLQKDNAISGYFGNDDFVVLMPYNQEKIEQFDKDISSLIKSHCDKMNILHTFGIYTIKNKSEPIFTMYDRAKLACSYVTENFSTRYRYFDSEMLNKLESEYILLSDIQQALENKEFTFYLQPKCNMKNGKIYGAEALVRWIHPIKGIISPGIFIPFLEKNGLIAELDQYIWDNVCNWQRQMLDKGYKTVPISVNVSRIDIYSIDIVPHFLNLIKKYDLDPKLIEIEITESAYSDDDEFINKIVEEFHKHGFKISIDDFGSAYSSLNMLKDVAVDILKADMRFLDIDNSNEAKGKSIIETIYNMARILGLELIIEGVETKDQKDFLVEIGCNYGQGFYYYRPLPIDAFEKLLSDDSNLDIHVEDDDIIEDLNIRDILNKNLFSEIMLNNILGPIAFYNVSDDRIVVERYNENYANLIAYQAPYKRKIILNDYLYKQGHHKLMSLFEKAKENPSSGASGDILRMKHDGTEMWLHTQIFFLHDHDNQSIFYSTVSDVSEIYKKNEALRFFNEDMPGGYYRHKNNEGYEFTYLSERFLNIFGYTKKEIEELFDNKFVNMVHPDDRHLLQQSVSAIEETHRNYIQAYRMKSKNGYIPVTDQSRLLKYKDTEIYQGIILCDYQVTSNEAKDWELTKFKEISQLPGSIIFEYLSVSDTLTIQWTPQHGNSQKIQLVKYLENVENSGFIEKEYIDDHLRTIKNLLTHPFVGKSKLKARLFTKNEFEWYQIHFKSIANEQGKVTRIIGKLDNIEQNEQVLSVWKERAMKDSLTGLYNTSSFKIGAKKTLQKNNGGTLFLLDLDNFKEVNDTYGHLKGDSVLLSISKILHSTFKEEDILARLGGDEFIVFAPSVQNEEHAEIKAQKLLTNLRNNKIINDLHTSCSVGISISKTNTTTIDLMLQEADVALYDSKRSGKDTYTIYGKGLCI